MEEIKEPTVLYCYKIGGVRYYTPNVILAFARAKYFGVEVYEEVFL